ncbi:SPFH domain-containing protein [Methylocella sp. CPCC 101449]|uniref:SPFH domain-containing protein n=1 Tax=Methylocella sp. CPCC 101449 TaxID=2987531 RepID=UPI00288F9A2C|nr:SPFH domain-containing protein [Methylocella sp. CPCC 101449]MDT2023933.1 SPFH/Band 7/PHB domain protein [Methylocella sp. CPCC 101449]
MSGLGLFAIAFVLFVIVTLLMGVRQVPQGYAYTVERFGKYYKTLFPGLGIIMPWIDRIGRKINVMEQVLDVPTQEVITKDNASVSVDGVLFFQVLDAARASYEVSNLEIALLNLTMTNIRTVMGSMDLDQLLSHRDEINNRLLSVIEQAAQPWGIKTNRVEIKDIVPPRDLVDSMARQMKAEREKRASVLEAEGQRQAEILRAEGRKQAVVLEAEGRKEAAFRDAEARERQALAEAEATRSVSEAIAKGDIAALNYFIAEKYVRAIDALAHSTNQKTFLMPMDMAGIAGTLAGITELTREAASAHSSAGGEARRGSSLPPTNRG